jgi:NADP-dependent 3-hydroxy acid dehydrogenase YdfG
MWVLLTSIAFLVIFLISDANLPLFLAPALPATGAFQDQVVWIVGASSGIGAQLAEDFSRQSAKVILSSRRVSLLNSLAIKCSTLYEESLQTEPKSVTRSPQEQSPAAYVLPLDITQYDGDAHDNAVAEILRVYGRIDLIVLNAGIYQVEEAMYTNAETLQEVMNVNFLSFIALTKRILPVMISQKHGKVSFNIKHVSTGFRFSIMFTSYRLQ